MRSSTVLPLRPDLDGHPDALAATAELAPDPSLTRLGSVDRGLGAASVAGADARLATPSAAQLARLAMWREWSARWPLHVVMGLILAMSQLLPEGWREGGGIFALISVVIYAGALGVGPRAREESFWLSLGGAPAVRAGVKTLVELGFVGLALLLVRGAEPTQVMLAAVLSASALSLAGFARLFAATGPGRLLVVAGVILFSAATLLPSFWIARWPLSMGLAWRLGLLVGGGLLLRVLWARRHPLPAAGRTRRRHEWVLLPMATALVLVVEAGWTEPVGHHDGPDISGLVEPEGFTPILNAQRVWWFDGDAYHALPLRGPLVDALRADSGAVVFESIGGWLREPGLGLMAPDGDQRICEHVGSLRQTWVADDGRSATGLFDDGTLLVVDVDAGCSTRDDLPTTLPVLFELANRDRAAQGRPPITVGDEPGTVDIPRQDGAVAVLDLRTGTVR